MPLAITYRTEAPGGNPIEGLARLAPTAPHPIAVPLSLAASEKRPAHRFMLLLKNLLDAVLRYAALVATSDYLAGRSPPSDRVNTSLAELVRKKPLEGNWLSLLRECVAACGASSLVPELGAFLRSSELDRRAQVRVSFPEVGLEHGWSGKLSAWIGLRNSLLAHGPSPKDLSQVSLEIARLALSVLEAMQPLFPYLLVRRMPSVGPVVLRGPSRVDFPAYSGAALQAEVFLAHEREDRQLEIHPLLVAGAETEKALHEVGAESVLLYDHLRSRTVVYRNESMIERRRADKFDALRAVLSERGIELFRKEAQVKTFEELQAASRAQVDRMVQREIDERRSDPTTYLVRERVERHLKTFSEGPAEALFMVGESGCGKSNTLFRYAAAQAAAGGVVLIARASTLWEKGLPSLTELEEALRREMGIKEELDRWVQLASEANEGKLPSERRSVLLIIDQLDSFMGQGRTPWGLFRRLEELVRRHEGGHCLKLVTAIRRESVQDILAETGSEPPLGTACHYQPGDEVKGPEHPSWFLTVGSLNDLEAGQLLESSMRARGLAPARFEELSKGWRRVLRIPYAVRRYAEACEVLGKTPRFRASLHELEKILHAARAERRQEILMQLVRYCAEHHVADPSVDEILGTGGPLARAVDEIGSGSDYEWLRENGLVREDIIRLKDGTSHSRITFSHDRIFDSVQRVHKKTIRSLELWDVVAATVILSLLLGIFILGPLAILHYVMKSKLQSLWQQFEQLGVDSMPLATARDAFAAMTIRLVAVAICYVLAGAVALAVLLDIASRLLRVGDHVAHVIAKPSARERMEEARLEAAVHMRVRMRVFHTRIRMGTVARAIAGIMVILFLAVAFLDTTYRLAAFAVVLAGLVLPAWVCFYLIGPAERAAIENDPEDLWQLDRRLLWGRQSWVGFWVGYGVAAVALLTLALVLPLAGRGMYHLNNKWGPWVCTPASEVETALDDFVARPDVSEEARKQGTELIEWARMETFLLDKDETGAFMSKLALGVAVTTALLALSAPLAKLLSSWYATRKLLAGLAAKRAEAEG